MKDDQGKRMVFGDVVDRAFWGLLTFIGGFGVMQMNGLNANISKLNETVAVMNSENADVKRRIDLLEKFKEDLQNRQHKLQEQKETP